MNIEFDIKEILLRIESKGDNLTETVNGLKVDNANLKGEIKVTNERIESLELDCSNTYTWQTLSPLQAIALQLVVFHQRVEQAIRNYEITCQ